MYNITDIFDLPLSNNGSINTKRLYGDMLQKDDILSRAETRIYDIFGGENTCKSFWIMLHRSELDNRVKQFMWKKIHKGLATRSILYDWKLVDTRTCLLCKTSDETLSHLFTDCTITTLFTVEALQVVNTDITLNDSYVLHTNHEQLSYIQFYIICMLQWTIWCGRNLVSLKNVPMSTASLKAKFINSVTSHLNVLWIKHKSNKTQKKFLSNYCSTNVCSLENDKIVFVY